MEVFPVLYTDRLKLRKIEVDDVPLLIKYANNKKISDYVLNIPYPYQEHDAVFRISYVWQGFKNKARYVFAVILKENEEFIGEIGLHMDGNGKLAQLGYWVAEPMWNKGIATEAVNAVLKFGFEKLQMEKIFATCHADNPASGKVLEKNHMEAGQENGNVIQYTITEQAYNVMD